MLSQKLDESAPHPWWGIELAFFRTKVGKEFSIVDRLSKGGADGTFFGTYGYFDLTFIKCIKSLSVASLVPLDPDILEAAPFRFFSTSSGNDAAFQDQIKQSRAAVAVFLKINPVIFQIGPTTCRQQLTEYLKANYRSGHVFTGLGYSELLLILGGDDLPALLQTITALRTARDTSSPEPQLPYFIRTTTFPLVSCGRVHGQARYEELGGKIHPVVTISCDPAVESEIVQSLPSNVRVHNMYGETDLIIYWPGDEGVPLSSFAKFLTELRSQWETSNLLAKTTSYLETTRLPPGSVKLAGGQKNDLADPVDSELRGDLENLEPLALRASVADLLMRLSACLRDRTIEADYRDMRNVFPYVRNLVRIAVTEADPTKNIKACAALAATADLARLAINQRYAGLELHPETLAHSQSPVLCDIRTLLLAASALPYFIFDKLHADRRAAANWAGYVLFGTTYSPAQYEHQNILALPTKSIYEPIGEWWKITHEVAHAIYGLLIFSNKLPDNMINDLTEYYDNSPISVEHVFNEVFANWFDWRYVFKGDTIFFLTSIWKSWLKVPLVLENPIQYLVRSFAIYMCDHLDALTQSAEAGTIEASVKPFLKEHWIKFKAILQAVDSRVSRFTGAPAYEDAVLDQVYRLAVLLEFLQRSFEAKFNLQGLRERISPEYAELAVHIESLMRGQTVEDVVDPCALHLALLRALNGNRPSLGTEIAFLLSLENWFVRRSATLGAEV